MVAMGGKTVVVVDDDASMCEYLSETLTLGGYECETFPNGAAALGWLASTDRRVDLLLSDVNMPGMNGLDLLRTVKAVAPELPFILVSGACDLPIAQAALRAGATDYLLKPVRPADLVGLVSKHLNGLQAERLSAVKEAVQRTLGGGDAGDSNRAGQLLPIFDAMGIHRFETLQHSRRVSAFTLMMARDLGMSADARRALEIGALLHDIGKAGIPHNVLMKPGKLNDVEWVIMKLHPQLGLDVLAGLPGLERESEIVYCHHERFDGKGYPRGLAGDAIPLSARIFSIADILDALTSDRCYRNRSALPAARIEIHGLDGTQFDPAALKLFERVTDRELEEVRRRFPDL
jgi:putative nucleotidyltransferase with HDIG domain